MRGKRFDDRVAVVTGGSNGLGRAITSEFAAAGARVLVCDLVDTGFFTNKPEITTIVADVADHGTAALAMDTAIGRWGHVDILVNDAAAYPDGTVLEMPGPEWDRVFAVNVTGAFLLMPITDTPGPEVFGCLLGRYSVVLRHCQSRSQHWLVRRVHEVLHEAGRRK